MAIEKQKESRRVAPREPWQLDTHGFYPEVIHVSGPYRSPAWSKLLIELKGETTAWEQVELRVVRHQEKISESREFAIAEFAHSAAKERFTRQTVVAPGAVVVFFR
jgi:hypothetical protein